MEKGSMMCAPFLVMNKNNIRYLNKLIRIYSEGLPVCLLLKYFPLKKFQHFVRHATK